MIKLKKRNYFLVFNISLLAYLPSLLRKKKLKLGNIVFVRWKYPRGKSIRIYGRAHNRARIVEYFQHNSFICALQLTFSVLFLLSFFNVR